jgi:hypothetical protein
MIQYPSQLPVPLQDGYAINTDNPKLSSVMASGRVRERRRFTTVPTLIQVRWNMDQNQAAYFESWFRTALVDGTEWIEGTLLTPIGFKPYIYKIRGMYDGPTLVQVSRWEFTALVELLERPLMPPEWLPFPDLWFGMNIIDVAMNKEWPEA